MKFILSISAVLASHPATREIAHVAALEYFRAGEELRTAQLAFYISGDIQNIARAMQIKSLMDRYTDAVEACVTAHSALVQPEVASPLREAGKGWDSWFNRFQGRN